MPHDSRTERGLWIHSLFCDSGRFCAQDQHNTELRRQRKEFESNSLVGTPSAGALGRLEELVATEAVERFVGERRGAVKCLAEALRQHAVGLAEGQELRANDWLLNFINENTCNVNVNGNIWKRLETHNLYFGMISKILFDIWCSSVISDQPGQQLDLSFVPSCWLERLGWTADLNPCPLWEFLFGKTSAMANKHQKRFGCFTFVAKRYPI